MSETTSRAVWLAVYRDELARRQRDAPYDGPEEWHKDASEMAIRAVKEFDLAFGLFTESGCQYDSVMRDA